MESKVRVEELRDELSKKIESTQVKRPESAILEESVYLRNPIGSIDKLRKLKIKELREQASLGGASTSGLKEKLDPDTKSKNSLLDEYIPDEVKSQYHLLQQGNEIYNATLNKTDVGGNNNKFYIIQALESDDGSTFMVYNRWGRVGVQGIDKLHGPYTSLKLALDEFEHKFLAKTQNRWSDRKQFVSQPTYYTWFEMDYGTGEETVDQKQQLRETKLETRTAKFIYLICNVDTMEKQFGEIGYNAEELPLGKLSIATTSKVLKTVADVIGPNSKEKLEQLSGDFITIIPHNFGDEKLRNFVTYTPQKFKPKLEKVEVLGDTEVAPKLLDDNAWKEEDPLLSRYERLHCELTPVEVDSKDFNMIQKYMKNTHAKIHSNYTVAITQIFRVSRHGEADSFSKFSNSNNRMLLWHGSPLPNWAGILSEGLRMPPLEAPVTWHMFGKGIYFADMFSKSANFCHASQQASSGVLLLCEVALGDMVELVEGKHDADMLPPGKLSTKGVGFYTPDMSEMETLEDGVVVPLGRPKQQLNSKGSLRFNEYIVYNVNQIRMRYVVQVKFKFNKQSARSKKEKQVAL